MSTSAAEYRDFWSGSRVALAALHWPLSGAGSGNINATRSPRLNQIPAPAKMKSVRASCLRVRGSPAWLVCRGPAREWPERNEFDNLIGRDASSELHYWARKCTRTCTITPLTACERLTPAAEFERQWGAAPVPGGIDGWARICAAPADEHVAARARASEQCTLECAPVCAGPTMAPDLEVRHRKQGQLELAAVRVVRMRQKCQHGRRAGAGGAGRRRSLLLSVD